MKKILFSAFIATTSICTAYAQLEEQHSFDSLPYFNQTKDGYQLEFDGKNYRSFTVQVNGKSLKFRAFEKIVYVKYPTNADYQSLNFYVPEIYFEGGTINGFNLETAPIFLPNAVGGYMPAKPATYDNKGFGSGEKPNAILTALSKGYVVASVGARGRTLEQNGKYTGKAPAAIIDLKSAVRYLHFNDARMPGDANKIISNGTSAGGALSALLGASGDSLDYKPYFQSLGAAEASDTIFAVSAYCPITNLEQADKAYEWEFNGLNQFSRIDMSKLNAQTFNVRSKPMPRIEGNLTETEIQTSNELKSLFPAYLNALDLRDENNQPLTLDEKGKGSFETYMKNQILKSAQQAYASGTDLSDFDWIKIDKNGVQDLDWYGYIHSAKRMKSPPAFDSLDLSSGENNLFGTETINNQHFTEYSQQHSKVQGSLANKETIKLMNVMNYINNPKSAQHWRIRVGTADRDTSHAISAILAIKLSMSGKNVDYAMPWAVPHSGDYDLDELFEWIDNLTKN